MPGRGSGTLPPVLPCSYCGRSGHVSCDCPERLHAYIADMRREMVGCAELCGYALRRVESLERMLFSVNIKPRKERRPMANPYFVETPPAQTSEPTAYFVIGTRGGGWGQTRVVVTPSAGNEIGTYPQGAKDFPLPLDGPFSGPSSVHFSFVDQKSGEEYATLDYSWEVTS